VCDGSCEGAVIGDADRSLFTRFGLRPVCIDDRQERSRLHVVELTVVYRPEEGDACTDENQDRQRNQEHEAVHVDARLGDAARAATARRWRNASGTTAAALRSTAAEVTRPMRIAFSTTTSELADMPIAASQGGTKPSAASGTAARLYPSAQRRFCRRIESISRASKRASTSAPSCPVITISLAACAASAADSTATATSAPASIGASFTPSATTATRAPVARSDSTHASLSAGE